MPVHYQPAIEAAAVLETFDTPALTALLEEPAEAALALLLDAGHLQAAGPPYQLTPTAQAAALQSLEAAPERLRELHGRAARHYAAGLAAADPAAEQAYMHHLEQRCEALIQQDPTALLAEALAAPLELLSVPRHRQLLRYYRGLGAGLLERFAASDAEFAALLAEADLDDTIRGRVLNSAATFARIQGDYERARDGYRQSYAIWQRLGNLARQGTALMNQGVLSYLLQDYSAAERDLLASLHLFREVDAIHSLALAAMNLGLLARDQGRWDEALGHSRQAAALFEQEGATEFLGYVDNNIGEIELLRGNLTLALSHFERALHQMSTRTYVVDTRLNMGLVCQAQGDDPTALTHYHAALELALELGRREIVALIHYRIGHASQRLGEHAAAQASYDAAISVIEDTRDPIRDEGLLINLMGRWQQVYEAAVQLCLARDAHGAAFDYAERARARAFADMLARRGAGLEQTSITPLTASEVQAALPEGTLLLAYFATGLRGPESALLDAIPGEAAGLRTCLATPPQLLLLALTRSGLRTHRCPIDPNALQSSSAYQSDGRRFLNVLRPAYSALLAPVEDLLDQATRVVIVPHGPLHQLPFAALLDSTGRPILDRPPYLSYAPSATVLLRALALRRPAPALRCLALGYDGISGQSASAAPLPTPAQLTRRDAGHRLRHTEPEADSVARICAGIAWHGSAGVGQRLQDEAGRYRWLHIACHGEFNLNDPLRSWLQIGPHEQLSAADVIASLQLQAELVTLSACRSGMSQIVRGDEPLGLVRAFLSAGARAVLVTLWPVEDTSARLLMEHFYTALLAQGEPADPAAALRSAQRTLRGLTVAQLRDRLTSWGEQETAVTDDLDDDAQPYADPAFWAAYALVGAPPVSIST